MIYGDNPQEIHEQEDKLGLKTYSYAPQITVVMQSRNLYVYAIENPVLYADPSGERTKEQADKIITDNHDYNKKLMGLA